MLGSIAIFTELLVKVKGERLPRLLPLKLGILRVNCIGEGKTTVGPQKQG